jgi:predicted peptidase
MKYLILIFCAVLVSPAVKAQQDYLFKTHKTEEGTLPYRVLLPPEFVESKTYPLILFLHGAGERGSDNEKQLTHGADLFISSQDKYPAIVVFPQCPEDDYWARIEADRSTLPFEFSFHYDRGPGRSMRLVISMLDSIENLNYVDQNRLYLGGLSMGGMGTYELLYRRPDTFAAAFSICGAGDINSVEQYAKSTPVWMFHGARDVVVLPGYSVDMFIAISKAGGNPKFDLYKEANHNSWDRAFAEANLLPWLFSHQRN